MEIERNTRKGFFEREALEALCRHLPAHLVPPVRFAYITGWRRGEVLGLRRRHVDFIAAEVRLEPGETKNGEGRTFPLVRELGELLRAVIPAVGFPNDPVFTVTNFKRSWVKACRAAGLPVRYVPLKRIDPVTGKRAPAAYRRGPRKGQPILICRAAVHFHDFRRTAYRNLLRMGTIESVARAAVGWLDARTADRYNIVAKSDLDALREMYDAHTPHTPSHSVEKKLN